MLGVPGLALRHRRTKFPAPVRMLLAGLCTLTLPLLGDAPGLAIAVREASGLESTTDSSLHSPLSKTASAEQRAAAGEGEAFAARGNELRKGLAFSSKGAPTHFFGVAFEFFGLSLRASSGHPCMT